MTGERDPDKLTRIARMDLREIEEEFVSLADMQRRIMPHPGRVTAYADYDIFGVTLPTAVVGGDFYDFINLEGRFGLKDRFGVVIADAAGHGLVAAMLIRDFNTALYTAIAFEAAYAQDTTNSFFPRSIDACTGRPEPTSSSPRSTEKFTRTASSGTSTPATSAR